MTLVVFANYLRQKLQERLKEKRRAEGYAEGRAEGHAIWRDWNARREKAKANGEPFDEPPPDLE